MMSLRLILRDMIYVFEIGSKKYSLFFEGKMFFRKIGKIKKISRRMGFETLSGSQMISDRKMI